MSLGQRKRQQGGGRPHRGGCSCCPRPARKPRSAAAHGSEARCSTQQYGSARGSRAAAAVWLSKRQQSGGSSGAAGGRSPGRTFSSGALSRTPRISAASRRVISGWKPPARRQQHAGAAPGRGLEGGRATWQERRQRRQRRRRRHLPAMEVTALLPAPRPPRALTLVEGAHARPRCLPSCKRLHGGAGTVGGGAHRQPRDERRGLRGSSRAAGDVSVAR